MFEIVGIGGVLYVSSIMSNILVMRLSKVVQIACHDYLVVVRVREFGVELVLENWVGKVS